MLKSVCVESKKKGKGIRKSTSQITEVDLERISEYFCHDHMNSPDPKRLQQQMIFYIIYYFCRRGRENLYDMTKETFHIEVEPDGTEFIYQFLDEIDENHGADDISKTKGRVYSNNGKCYFFPRFK